MLVVAAVLSACSSESSQPATEIMLEMTDFAYSSPSITISAGQPVVLTIENAGRIEHDFVIEKIDVKTKVIKDSGSEEHHAHGAQAAYDLHISAPVGELSILQFTVAEPGTYRFFCSVEGHLEAGMIGELTVLARQ